MTDLKGKIEDKIQAYKQLFAHTYMNTKVNGAGEAWKRRHEVKKHGINEPSN